MVSPDSTLPVVNITRVRWLLQIIWCLLDKRESETITLIYTSRLQQDTFPSALMTTYVIYFRAYHRNANAIEIGTTDEIYYLFNYSNLSHLYDPIGRTSNMPMRLEDMIYYNTIINIDIMNSNKWITQCENEPLIYVHNSLTENITVVYNSLRFSASVW